MASTERRRSLSLPFAPFFSFRSDSKSDKTPRLRRKLQKVTKSTEADACTAAETSDRPLTQVSDGAFLSIKYEARQPATATRPATGHGRSSSSSRPATASTPSRHSVVIGGLPHPQLQPQPQPQPHFQPAAAAAEAQRQKAEKKLQAETQARAMAMVDAQERAQTKTKPVPLPLPLPLVVPQSVPRHHPQYHRPYHSQPVTPYGRQNGSAYSFSARHSMAASIVSSSPSSPSSVSLLSSPSTISTATSAQSFTPSYGMPWSPPRSSSSLITPPSSSCSSQHFPSPCISGSPSRVVPELSHLGPNSSQSQSQKHGRSRYRGVSGAPPTALDSPKSDVSNASSTSISQPRRKPKTPVYVIGQLESGSSDDQSTQSTQSQQQLQHQQKMSQTSSAALGIQTPPESPLFVAATTTVAAELSLLQSKSSIECIAEQYRALLASRNSMLTDARSVLEPETEDDEDKPVRRHGHLVPEQRRFMLSPPPTKKKDTAESVSESVSTVSPLPSPLFPRRVSQTPMHSNSHSNAHSNAHSNTSSSAAAAPLNYSKKGASMRKLATPPPSPPASQSQPDNLSLQICLDLLTRELSSAVTDRHMMSTGLRSGSTTTAAAPALQILVMIEAYERLRDQLVDEARRKRNGSSGQVEAMFSLWLQSLYKIHDSLTSSSAGDKYEEDGQMSESAYDSAEE